MTTSPTPAATRIDPRGPRFGAAVTAVLLLITFVLAVPSAAAPAPALSARLLQPAALLLIVITALFAVGAFAGVQRHPYGRFFARVIRPRLQPPAETEDAAPPTFAQGVGFAITLVALVLHLVGVPYALVIGVALAFVAAFLNAAFGICLGCLMYLGLQRLRTVAS